MTVYTYLPAKLEADSATIVFVMHGQGKDAEAYRDAWAAHADKYRFMVIAPLFDAKTWGSGYANGQDLMRDGKPTDSAMWSFSVIEHLFDAIKLATGNKSITYKIYGHSEGGQFVHRLVWFLPEARFERAVAANPGWYTMPDLAVALPYGLANSPATEQTLKQSLERDLTVMLGARDNDPNHPQLRKTPQAMAQGRFRLARGENFYKQADERCAQLKCKFGWQMQIVPDAAHSNTQMAGTAAAVLMRK
jgi:poly(3-hydroxybutyrate) depolymerase